MVARILDGRKLASEILEDVRSQVEIVSRDLGRAPVLAVIMVGEDPASKIYVKRKRLACGQVGIVSRQYSFSGGVFQDVLLELIQSLNDADDVDGILLQLPLPEHIEVNRLLEAISPFKDVDGFHPYNIGRLLQWRPLMRPCTPWGVMQLLAQAHESVKGLHAVVVGCSNIVGKPMSLELLLAGATVTVCHRHTHDLAKHLQVADILVSAVGNPEFISGDSIKVGATVIDVGISRLSSGQIKGDIHFESASERADWITPVPGGVGPMTVAMLLCNTLLAAKSKKKGQTPPFLE